MFSYKVTCAIQILSELEKAGWEGRRLTVTELKELCCLESRWMSNTMSALRRKGWIDRIGCYHFVGVDLTLATVYDLVLAMDGRICLGGFSMMDTWPPFNRDTHQKAIALDDKLDEEMAIRLRNIPIRELFPCRELSKHKLSAKQRRQNLGAKIVEGRVVRKKKYEAR